MKRMAERTREEIEKELIAALDVCRDEDDSLPLKLDEALETIDRDLWTAIVKHYTAKMPEIVASLKSEIFKYLNLSNSEIALIDEKLSVLIESVYRTSPDPMLAYADHTWNANCEVILSEGSSGFSSSLAERL